MIYREAGQFKATYADGPADLSRSARTGSPIAAFSPPRSSSCPLIGNDYWFDAILIPLLILLAGDARPEHPDRLRRPALARDRGVHGRRRVRGVQPDAARAAHAAARAPSPGRARARRWSGSSFGLPSLRIKGFYLAVTTLAGAVLHRVGADEVRLVLQQQSVRASSARRRWSSSATRFDSPRPAKYLLICSVVAVLALAAKNMVRSRSAAPGWRCATWTSPPR